MQSVEWPLPWISALEATRSAWLLALTMLQGTTGWLGWTALCATLAEDACETRLTRKVIPQPAALGAAALFFALVAIALVAQYDPQAVALLRPLVVSLGVLCAAGLVAHGIALAALARPGLSLPRRSIVAWVGFAGGIALLIAAGAMMSARLQPGLVEGWSSPASVLVAALLVPSCSAACTLGVILLQPSQLPDWTPWLFASITSVTAFWMTSLMGWLPAELGSTPQAGPQDWPTRLCLLSSFAWLSVGWLWILAARQSRSRPPPLAITTLAVVACVAANASWTARLGPWSVRNQAYANGLLVEWVTAHRRSPLLSQALDDTELPGRMVEAQCAPCHGSPGRRKKSLFPRDRSQTRALLETLRDADRPGNPFQERMPPLVGSDKEVDVLADWLSRR